MTDSLYSGVSIAVPGDIAEIHARAIERFVSPGAFLDGATRRAVVEATRSARSCPLCAARREALSPASVEGEHQAADHLPPPLVELAHKLVTDPGRVTDAWCEGLLQAGLSREEYVEASGLVGTAIIIDTFASAVGAGMPALPPARDGEPTREANEHVVEAGARVPIMDTAYPPEGWQGRSNIANIGRALALVPLALNEFWDVMRRHYRPMQADPSRPFARPQMEFIASRVSSLNDCFY